MKVRIVIINKGEVGESREVYETSRNVIKSVAVEGRNGVGATIPIYTTSNYYH